MARKVKKKRATKRSKKATLKSSLLLDESLLALLNAPGKRGIQGKQLKAKRERWIDMMLERAPKDGKVRGKAHRFPGAEKSRKPEPKQFYSESRALADGKAVLQFLTHRPFIVRLLGYEGFTFAPRNKKKKAPSRADMKTIRDLDFVKELPAKERAAMVKHIADAYKRANSGGIMFAVEVDYERPQKRVELDESETDEWEDVKQRDAKGGATRARKARKNK